MPDPRLEGRSVSANELLLDRAIRHAIHLERLKAGEVKRALAFLDEHLFPDLLALFASRLDRIRSRGFDSGVLTTQRLRDMLSSVDALLVERLNGERTSLATNLIDIGKYEAGWQAKAITQASPVDLEVTLPDLRSISRIVTQRPFQGRILRDWYSDLAQSTQKQLRQQINIGLVEGESTQTLVNRVRGFLDTPRRQVEAIVRTAVTHTTAHARHGTYEENADLIKGWRFVATLDSRTTLICASLDGQVFALGEGPTPPRHYNCRSTTTPVLKSWRELGIDLDEAPEGTRASMDGQVPGDLTFPDWLKRQPIAVQVEVLGRRRAELFRAGRVSIDRFLDETGRTLTLEELVRAHPN